MDCGSGSGWGVIIVDRGKKIFELQYQKGGSDPH